MERREQDRRLCRRVEYDCTEKACILKDRDLKYSGFIVDLSCAGLKISGLPKNAVTEGSVYVVSFTYAGIQQYLRVTVMWKNGDDRTTTCGLKLYEFSNSWVAALVTKNYSF